MCKRKDNYPNMDSNRNVSDTSILSHSKNKKEKFYTGLQAQIISILSQKKEASRRNLSQLMGKELSSLCGAIKALENEGIISYRKGKCSTTDNTVRFYFIPSKPNPGRQIELF